MQAQPNTYNTIDQVINYSFLVTNTGTSNLPGPVSNSDNKMVVVTCPEVNTVGNKDNNLNPAEAITCTGGYKTTQADISNGSMTNTSTATVGGQSSNPVNTTIQAQLNQVLTIAATATRPATAWPGRTLPFPIPLPTPGRLPSARRSSSLKTA